MAVSCMVWPWRIAEAGALTVIDEGIAATVRSPEVPLIYGHRESVAVTVLSMPVDVRARLPLDAAPLLNARLAGDTGIDY